MVNPYQSPRTHSIDRSQSPITDDHVLRLIDGVETETFFFSEVSDVHLYGRKHKRQLTGTLADAAWQAGCEAVVYQAVYWWCFLYIPVVPLAVYFVIPCLGSDDLDDDFDCYRGLRAPWDGAQVAAHYYIAVVVFAVIALGVLVWWTAV